MMLKKERKNNKGLSKAYDVKLVRGIRPLKYSFAIFPRAYDIKLLRGPLWPFWYHVPLEKGWGGFITRQGIFLVPPSCNV
jgi:hypothetical protein